jgi:hypothetical protein
MEKPTFKSNKIDNSSQDHPTQADPQIVREKSKRAAIEASRMFRNQYYTDVTTFSPHGRIFQMEYTMEAVKQGAACVGLRSRTHAALTAANKPPPSSPRTSAWSSASPTTQGSHSRGSPPTDVFSPDTSAASVSTTPSSTKRRFPSPGSRSDSRTRRRSVSIARSGSGFRVLTYMVEGSDLVVELRFRV